MQSSNEYVQKLRAEIARAEERQVELKTEIQREAARIKGLTDALAIYRATHPTNRTSIKRIRVKPKPESRFGFVLERIKAAGPHGLTIEEMFREAEAAGIKIKRPSLRSQLFDRKQKGLLVYKGGRYSVAPEPARTGSGHNGEEPDAKASSPSIQ